MDILCEMCQILRIPPFPRPNRSNLWEVPYVNEEGKCANVNMSQYVPREQLPGPTLGAKFRPAEYAPEALGIRLGALKGIQPSPLKGPGGPHPGVRGWPMPLRDSIGDLLDPRVTPLGPGGPQGSILDPKWDPGNPSWVPLRAPNPRMAPNP